MRGIEGVGVVFAQHPSPPRQGVLIQIPRRPVLTKRPQVGGEAVRAVEGVGVILAQHPAAAGQGVLIQLQRLAVAAHLPQGTGEWLGGP